MLIVLVAPLYDDAYYAKAYDKIIDFQVKYAKSILENEDVRIIASGKSYDLYRDMLPPEILIDFEIFDIWARDYSTINPHKPCLFKYTSASMSKKESREVQASFTRFIEQANLEYKTSRLLIDGGNVVDNYQHKCIVTERFCEDNHLSKSEAQKELKMLLDCEYVSVIPADDPILAHSDGMVCWIDDNMLAVNHYEQDPKFREDVLHALYDDLGQFDFIEVPYYESDNAWPGFSSACGIYNNAVFTDKCLYVPQFGHKLDKEVLSIIQAHSNKKVIPVDAKAVCPMGGSVRCLSWQLAGENANKVLSI